MLVTFLHISLKNEKRPGWKMGRSREYFSWHCCQKEDPEIMAWRKDEAKGLDEGTERLGARDKTSGYI